MTTNRRRTNTADGAGAEALCGVFARARRTRARFTVRALRWKQDAVCRDAAADDARRDAAADSASSSLNRTIFFSSRIQTQTQTRKETNYTTQEKKSNQAQKNVTVHKKLETLA